MSTLKCCFPGNNCLVPTRPGNEAKTTIAFTSMSVRGLCSLEPPISRGIPPVFCFTVRLNFLCYYTLPISINWQKQSLHKQAGRLNHNIASSVETCLHPSPSFLLISLQALSNKGATSCFLTNHKPHCA